MSGDTCDVCSGEGDYPIYNEMGGYEFTVPCPKCFGSGKFAVQAPEEPLGHRFVEWIEDEPEDWPPPSTAARVHTIEELRAAVREWNGEDDEQPQGGRPQAQ